MEVSKELQEIFKYKKANGFHYNGDSIYAYVTKDNWVKFFLAYQDDIENELEYIQNTLMDDKENALESCKEIIEERSIIGGTFNITENQNHKPILYLDTDMSKRVPTREYLDDWMSRFGMIHNFVNEYHWLTRDLYKEV